MWTDSLSTSIREPDSTLSVVSSSTTGGARFCYTISTFPVMQNHDLAHASTSTLYGIAVARLIMMERSLHTSSTVCFCPGLGAAAAA